MNITRKDVEHVARLARLKLSEKEQETFTSQLEAIIAYIGQLNEVDTKNVPPMSHVHVPAKALRQDAAVKSPQELIEAILRDAPEREGNFFKVKKVIE
jgi:aspartyl-tRNA(Asn)/glutamyl-tRNA(Gln) amidotransferase subunit C